VSQRFIPARFYRGGTSKGVFFHAGDLPSDRGATDAILLSALGSPDPYGRQLNGMGGGTSSLSKVVIIGPPSHPDADVDYTFVQIAVDEPVADWSGNCGNLSSAVGPFAVDEGLIDVRGDEALVRIYQTNSKKLIHARFPLSQNKTEVRGDFAIAGVAGTGARIRLDFLEPAGAATGKLLPTGNVVDRVDLGEDGVFDLSIVDATALFAYVDAQVLGLTGAESPAEIEATPGLMARLERLRRTAGVKAGLAATPEAIGLQTPRIVIAAAPLTFTALDGTVYQPQDYDVAIRILSMQRAHNAIPGTGGLNVGVATQIEGTIANRLSRPASASGEVRVANPSGLVSVGAAVRHDADGWHAHSAVLFRTARLLMRGDVAVEGGN